jgi:hypothetical protein
MAVKCWEKSAMENPEGFEAGFVAGYLFAGRSKRAFSDRDVAAAKQRAMNAQVNRLLDEPEKKTKPRPRGRQQRNSRTKSGSRWRNVEFVAQPAKSARMRSTPSP